MKSISVVILIYYLWFLQLYLTPYFAISPKGQPSTLILSKVTGSNLLNLWLIMLSALFFSQLVDNGFATHVIVFYRFHSFSLLPKSEIATLLCLIWSWRKITSYTELTSISLNFWVIIRWFWSICTRLFSLLAVTISLWFKRNS